MLISDRLSILVEEITQGNRKAFAENAELKQATFNNYINKGRTPTVEALNNICNTYNVNLNWLVSGIGSRYIDDTNNTQPLDPDPEISELMEGARRVLTSGNPIAFDALERNIRYFDHAIAAEKRADKAEHEIKEMKENMDFLMQEFQKLKIENQRLDEEEEAQSSDEKAA